MIAALAVSAVHGRADSVACCAALALRGLVGAEASLVIVIGGPAQRPGLLASNAARRLEAAVAEASLDGVSAAARGHICLVSVTNEGDGLLAPAIAELAGGGCPVVVSTPPGELERWQRRLTLIRADLPADRDLLSLLADSPGEGAGVLRVDKRGPGRIGARRAIAGLEPGRAPQERYRWLCRGV